MEKLNLNEKQQVQYAAPLWLRDEQIKLNCATVKERLRPVEQPRAEPIAVVGFGPSLRETWEEIRKFKFIITCSGAHKFLIEHGIVPTWHCEVDPRPHKIELLGPPHGDVEYLIASTCSPQLIDYLKGFNVKLWHIFDNSDDGKRLLPAGEWQLFGGCDAGLRAMTLASFLGFRELHVFGLDGCARGEDRHAGPHPKGGKKFFEVEHNGVKYLTTPGMVEAAKMAVHELKQMPKVNAIFYGDGLTQALVREFKAQPSAPTVMDRAAMNIVGIEKPVLISAEYRDLNARLHRDNLLYGAGGSRHAGTVLKLCEALKTTSVLDYGAGKQLLARELPFPIWCYDPAVPEISASPRPADIVVCTDVLEHIEPDRLGWVLSDIARCTKKVCYFVIHTGPSSKMLADGRNSHILQRPAHWWKKVLKKFFTVAKDSIKEVPPLVYVVVAKKEKVEKPNGRSADTHHAAVRDGLPDFDYQI